MTNGADITLNNKSLVLTGDLNFYNVMSVYQKSLSYFANCQELEFDFSQLKSSDSASMALILEWMKAAKQCQKHIRFTNLSANIQAIATVSGLRGLLGL